MQVLALYSWITFCLRNLLIQIKVPVMGKLVPMRQKIKYRILENNPKISPVCNGLMLAAILAPKALSANFSVFKTLPEY